MPVNPIKRMTRDLVRQAIVATLPEVVSDPNLRVEQAGFNEDGEWQAFGRVGITPLGVGEGFIVA